MKRIALIPAYKPDKMMIDLLNRLSENGFEIVVVNDGSGSNYDSLFKEAEAFAHVISHKENKGKGAALKTGLEYINAHFEAPFVIVTADADGQHRIEDIKAVADNAERYPNEMTRGARQIDEAHMPFKNRSGNIFTRSAVFCVTGRYVSDSQTGLRGFSNKAIRLLLSANGSGYEYEMNALISWLKARGKIREVKIRTIYINNNASSHFKAWEDSKRIYREILRFSMASLISFTAMLIVFTALFFITKNILATNIFSGLCGAALNYTLNLKELFLCRSPLTKPPFKFWAYTAFTLALNTLLITVLSGAGAPAIPAKLLTEFVMFFANWVIQKQILR
jgi:glycosyltransferase involved in cell wall biosynthesis